MRKQTASGQGYEPLVTPAEWKGDELRFSVRLTQILDSIFARLRTLKTSTAVNSAKLGGRPPEYYLPLENLLHNSYFPEAVNQRGKSSYTGKAQYTIDRWKTTNANTTVDVLEDGIRLTNAAAGGGGYLQQTLENPSKWLGKTFTLAAMQTNGTLTVASAKLPGAFPSAITQYATLTDNGVTVGAIQVSTNSVWVRLWSNPNETTRSFRWAMLCEGEYTKDMLLYRRKPDELADCMRHFQIRSTKDVPFSDLRPPMFAPPHTVSQMEDGNWSYSCDL